MITSKIGQRIPKVHQGTALTNGDFGPFFLNHRSDGRTDLICRRLEFSHVLAVTLLVPCPTRTGAFPLVRADSLRDDIGRVRRRAAFDLKAVVMRLAVVKLLSMKS